MGRGEPTYDLELLQQLIGQGPVSSAITGAAKAGAGFFAFGNEEIVEAVLQLLPANFYKSMESESCRGLWQDVYHLVYRSVLLYIKLQMGADGRAVVVQFKQK
jgi:hypothetical protein